MSEAEKLSNSDKRERFLDKGLPERCVLTAEPARMKEHANWQIGNDFSKYKNCAHQQV
jgi:hypothetical protein